MEMILAGLLPLAFISAVVWVFVKAFSGAMGKYESIPTFMEYQRAHGTGCCHCGGNQIYIQKAGHTPTKILNIHLCRTCGNTLYRSEV